MIAIKSLFLTLASLGFLFISPNVLANYEQCIQAEQRQAICPHVIIRSIETSNPKYQNKAICICISDFKEAFNQSQKKSEQLSSKLKNAQNQYDISQEDLLELITGAS